jgi:sarcosine oxidase subunit alpha
MRAERVDVAVVGAGPAGLSAAAVAARSGASVVVLDESPRPGGRLPLQLHEAPTGWRMGHREAEALAAAAEAAGARIVTGAGVWGLFPGWELYLDPVDPADPGAVPDRVGAAAVVLATGAGQNPLALPGWTLPGVLCAGAAQMLVNVQRVRPGRRAVVVGVDPLALTVAHQLRLAGVEVRAILPPAPGPFVLGAARPADAVRQLARFAAHAPSAGLRLAGRLIDLGGVAGAAELAARFFPRDGTPIWGIPLMLRRAVTGIQGEATVTGVRVADLDGGGQVVAGSEEDWPVDTVVTSAGLFPLAELALAAGARVVHVPELGGHVPVHGPDLETSVAGLFVAGSLTGVAGAPVAAVQGCLAGIGVSRRLGLIVPGEAADRLEAARADLARARTDALPLMPDTERGLARLAAAWADATR